MARLTTQNEWENDMCIRILHLARNELYLDFRYFDAALCALSFAPDENLRTMAADGSRLLFSPEQTLRLFRENPVFLNRSFLHCVLHCIFRHLWLRGKREAALWNLASDIAVEWVTDSLDRPSVRRTLSLIRIQYYDHLRQLSLPVTAANIYRDLMSAADLEQQSKLQKEFYVDDHRYWPSEQTPSPSLARAGQNWEKIGRRAEKELELRGQEHSAASESIETQIRQGRNRRTYRDFLRKFTALREEIHCDYDEFDLNYYTYGLRLYKDMPLIEPLESREIMKISEFVIVIDTSYSTNGMLVRKFLEETFEIIHQRDSFFHDSHIHIIQCDNQVRSDTVIRDEIGLARLLGAFTLLGGGGTDFRPAFSYVNELLHDGTFHDLKGLLYFTDGKGVYPRKRPDYETAFIFIGQEEHPEVPPWAMQIHLTEEDLLQ